MSESAAAPKTTLKQFATFCADLVEQGVECTPEEAVARWHEFRPQLEGIQRALDQIDAGETIPADEVIAELREELEQELLSRVHA